MAGQWKTITKLSFCGHRFDGHALDVDALQELSRYQKIIAETAKTIWRQAHPGRERLPAHFEDRTRLYLRQIGEGSAVAPLDAYIEEEQDNLFPDQLDQSFPELSAAAVLSADVFYALDKGKPLPEAVPRELLPEYARFGEALGPDDRVNIEVPGGQPVPFAARSRERLLRLVETEHIDTVDITGEVVEANVRQGSFQITWAGDVVQGIPMSPEREGLITSALKEHSSARLRLVGKAEMTPQGRIKRLVEVDEMVVEETNIDVYDDSAPRIEDVIAGLTAAVPDEVWSAVPDDLAENHDRYLYGATCE